MNATAGVYKHTVHIKERPHRKFCLLCTQHWLWHRLCSDCRQISVVSSRQTVCSVIFKWSDRICVFRHHQPICMSCCGNSIGFCNCWWRCFPTRDTLSSSFSNQIFYKDVWMKFAVWCEQALNHVWSSTSLHCCSLLEYCWWTGNIWQLHTPLLSTSVRLC